MAGLTAIENSASALRLASRESRRVAFRVSPRFMRALVSHHPTAVLFRRITCSIALASAAAAALAQYGLHEDFFSDTPFVRASVSAATGFICLQYFAFRPARVAIFRSLRANARFQLWTVAFFSLTMLDLLVGLVHENSIKYVVSDTAFALLGGITYLAFRASVIEGGPVSIRCFSHRGDLMSCAWISTANTLAWISIPFMIIGIPPWSCISIILLIAFVAARGARLSLRHYVLPLVVTLALVPTQNRTFMVQFVLAIGIFSVLGVTGFHKLRNSVALAGVCVLAVLALLTLSPGSKLSRRLMTTAQSYVTERSSGDVDKISSDLLQRVIEARKVSEAFDGASVWRWLAGFGAGATLDMSDLPALWTTTYSSVSMEGARNVHNIHLGPYAYLYRQGILGLVVITWLGWAAVRELQAGLRQMRRRRIVNLQVVAASYLVLSFVICLTAQGNFQSDPMLMAFAGLLDGLLLVGREVEPEASHARGAVDFTDRATAAAVG